MPPPDIDDEPGLYPSSALHGRMAHELGRMIATGRIAEGELLEREEALSERYGASRHAIREALKVLAAKGMIVSRRRAGNRVTPRATWNILDPDVIAWHAPRDLSDLLFADLVEFRQLIEPPAAALAAIRGERQQVAGIGFALEDMRRGISDPEAWSTADAGFHAAVMKASGNSMLMRLGALLKPLLRPTVKIQVEEVLQPALEVALEQHEAVHQAILHHDPNAARKAMEDIVHLATSEVADINRFGRGTMAS